MKNTFLGSEKLFELGEKIGFTCLDLGARHNFIADMLPLAPHVNAIGFDADKEECSRLNAVIEKDGSEPWKSLKYIPTAIASKEEKERDFYLYKQRGCSSLLPAVEGFGDQFNRGEYYEMDKKVTLDTMPLDKAAVDHNFENVSFMKIDVEGAEIEVFEGGCNLLRDSILAIRTEASFAASHHNQPMYCDVETHLRQFNFLPFRFLEMHHWRCFTRTKSLVDNSCKFPFSYGQIIHGDMLFLKDFKCMPIETQDEIKQHIRLGIYAMIYGFIDHSSIILNQSPVKNFLKEEFSIDDIDQEILKVSQMFAKEFKSENNREFLRDVKRKVKGTIGL